NGLVQIDVNRLPFGRCTLRPISHAVLLNIQQSCHTTHMPDAPKADFFMVRVSRINESANQDPYITVEGHTLAVDADGGLIIEGTSGGRSFSRGTWNAFEVTRYA